MFENVYGADAVDAALAGTKKLQAAEGLTPADITGKFTFTVTADEAGAPMPERATATNDEVGNVDFGKIHFTLEDLNRALGVTTDASDDVPSDAEPTLTRPKLTPMRTPPMRTTPRSMATSPTPTTSPSPQLPPLRARTPLPTR